MGPELMPALGSQPVGDSTHKQSVICDADAMFSEKKAETTMQTC